MTTDQVLGIVKERGLKIELRDDRPVLVGAANNREVTDKLLAVLKVHREWIIERLKKGRP
jgi:hypothetical protein